MCGILTQARAELGDVFRFMFWTFPKYKYIQMYTYVLCIQSTYKTIVKEHRAATNTLKL